MNEGLAPNYIWKNIAFRGERKGVTPVDEGIFGKGTYYTTDINYAAQYGKTHKAQIEFKKSIYY